MLQQFKNIICLNLRTRPDRKRQSIEEFQKAGIEGVQFFPAYSGGYAGFNKSQRRIMNSYDGPLFVFEDDVEFINNYKDMDKVLAELPEDWDIIYLGGNLRSLIQKVTPNLWRANNLWTTHAVGYSEKMIKWLRQNYTGVSIYDEWLRVHVQPVKKCYITNPMMATQRSGFSNILRRDVNYKTIFEESTRFYK